MSPMAVPDALWRRLGQPPWWFASVWAWWSSGADATVYRRAVRALELSPDHRVCDLGFGPGTGLAYLLAQAHRGHVVGVDPSPELVRQAQRSFDPWIRAGQLAVVRGSASRIPVEDRSVDALLALRPSHGWPQLRAGATECARVLAPGGRLVALHGGDGPGAGAVRPEDAAEALRDEGFAVVIEDEPDGSCLLVASPVDEAARQLRLDRDFERR